MEKLIELLKESGKADEICPTWIDIRKQYFDAGNITRADRMMYEYICSKQFWFIKWLVENEKIDLDGYPDIDFFNDVNSLLMYLAIQDEPIEFLVSILK
jgi:hypothetical protein